MLVGGDAGIGKTALVERALEGRLPTVLRGAARASGAAPFSPLVAAIRTHPHWPAIAADVLPPAAVTGAARDLVSSLFDELAPSADLRTTGAAIADAAADASPDVTRDAVWHLVVELARIEPLAIVLDDLQRADYATIDALPGLAAAAAREPLLVVGIYRTDEMPRSSPVRRLRVELRRGGRLHEIVLGPLDATSTAALAARTLGARPDDLLAGRLFDRSQGLPLFVEELAAALVADDAVAIADGVATLVRDDLPIPETLRDSILIRADGMALRRSRGARHGRAARGRGGRGARRRAGRRGRHLATQRSGARDPRRPRREERRLPPLARARGSARRSAVGCEADPASPGRRAARGPRRGASRRGGALAARRRDIARPLASLVAAGEASSRVHAYRDAASAYRRALDEDQGTLASPVDVIERLASCLELSGNLGEAARTWETAAAARALDGRPDLAAEDHRRRARVLEIQGRWPRAIEARLAAVAGFEAVGRPADAATERLAAAAHLRSAADFTAALAILDDATAEARAAERIDLEARAIGLTGNVLARMGRPDEGLPLVRRGLSLALDAGHTAAAAELFQRLADSLEHAGSYDPARSAYLEGADYCRTRCDRVDGTALPRLHVGRPMADGRVAGG